MLRSGCALVLVVCMTAGGPLAVAQGAPFSPEAGPAEPPPSPARAVQPVHPIWGTFPDAPREAEAKRTFSEIAARYRLGAVETIDVPSPPPPRAPEQLRRGVAAVEKLRFDEGAALLDAAADEALATGGAGLSTKDLSELFLFQAIAAQRADWNTPEPAGEITPPKARQAYLRALTMTPERQLEARRFPPAVRASWQRLQAETAQRERGALVVRASPRAQITVNGGPPLLSPATVPDLVHGEHLVRVEDPGFEPWAEAIPLTDPMITIDVPPRKPLTLPDATAAAHARRMGAAFALVAEMKLGPRTGIEVRLVNAATGEARDATVVPLDQRGALDAAVMRLDENARRAFLRGQGVVVDSEGAPEGAPPRAWAVGPSPRRPADPDRPLFSEDPGAWMKDRWPLVTAVGVAALTAFTLGFLVARDTGPMPQR